MYEFNGKAYKRYRQLATLGSASSASSDKEWGRERARRLVHAVITLSFVCLLRIDETLGLRLEDIELPQGPKSKSISITLQKRKTDQFGGMMASFLFKDINNLCTILAYPGTRPFVLWRFQENESHICPIRALSHWLVCSEIESGYIFRGIRVNKDIERINENPIVGYMLSSTEATNHICVRLHQHSWSSSGTC